LRVKGFLSSRFRPPAPLVEALINFPTIGKRHIILLIDTGASVTALLDGDASRFGITMDDASRHLKLASHKVVGIGGMAETYVVKGAELRFATEEGMEVSETFNLHVVLHDPRTLSVEESGLVLRLPSILGRDIINRYSLLFSASRGEVYLER